MCYKRNNTNLLNPCWPCYVSSLAVQLQEELNLAMAARRMSVAPLNRASSAQSRNLSWRSASVFWPRSTGILEGRHLNLFFFYLTSFILFLISFYLVFLSLSVSHSTQTTALSCSIKGYSCEAVSMLSWGLIGCKTKNFNFLPLNYYGRFLCHFRPTKV